MVEVASSSTSYDLHQKKDVYRRHGVRTYVVFMVADSRVRWLDLDDGRFVERRPDTDGIYRSKVFPGLWLDAPAMATGDLAKVLEVLDLGLGAPEHTRFMSSLSQKARPRGRR